MERFRSVSHSPNERWNERHRFEHWYRYNSVYFVTARCRDRFAAFATEQAKVIFRDRFDHWTHEYGFVPWIATLIDNHYHFLGYLKEGTNFGQRMRKLHGSTAKLGNDTLTQCHLPSGAEKVVAIILMAVFAMSFNAVVHTGIR